MYIEEFKTKTKFKINKITIIIAIIIILIITFFCLYFCNNWFKEKVNNLLAINNNVGVKVSTLDISQDKINSIMSYDKYLAVLMQGKLVTYSNSDTEEFSTDIAITNCISSYNSKYLALAQKNGENFYLFHGDELVYEAKADGTITNISVNKNGYIAVNVQKSGYRSVIELYDQKGQMLFTTFLASTYVSDIMISNNNKELAFIEIDTSGIKIISRIKVVDINKLDKNTAIKQLVEENDAVISKINFLNNSEIIYLTEHKVSKVNLDGNVSNIYEITSSEITNVDFNLENYIAIVEKADEGIFNTHTDVNILDKNGSELGKYTLDGTVKMLRMNDNIICIGIGQEVHFITATGRLIKKYKTSMDIKDVYIYNNGNQAALIYRNKIEIINI